MSWLPSKIGVQDTTQSLKEFDDTKPDKDEWETPQEVFGKLCQTYNINPYLDTCATYQNHKLPHYYTKEFNALFNQWPVDSWCNPPHSKTEQFVRKAFLEWKINNINIIMIIPTRCMSAKFWFDCIEGFAEYHPIERRIHFKQNGKDVGPAMQAYVCVLWRSK